MAGTVLVGYATRYGSTREVAEAVAATLRESGLSVDVRPLKQVRSLDGYGAVVIGAALYMYHWHKDARRFLARHRAALEQRPVAMFTLGPVKVPQDDAEGQQSREQIQKELATVPWLKPAAAELMGGKFDPAALRWPLNKFAGAEPASDARDWEAIRAWAAGLPALLGG